MADNSNKPDNWQPIETAPTKGTFLVWLEREKFGSNVYPMRTGKVALIGTLFAFDMPKPTHWRPMLEPPEGQ